MKKRIRNKIAKKAAAEAPAQMTPQESADAELVARIADATKHALGRVRSIEEKAEHLLSRVPMIGDVAAQRLHKLTHPH